MVICMLFVFFAIMELALVYYLSKKRVVATAKRKARQDEHQKYIDRLRTKFEAEMTGTDYVNFMPRGVSLILDAEPTPQRPFGKYQPTPVDQQSESNNSDTGPPTYELNRTINNNLSSSQPPSRLRTEFETDLIIKSVELPDRALLVDTVCRVAYPIAFAIFNAVYWPLLFSRRIL